MSKNAIPSCQFTLFLMIYFHYTKIVLEAAQTVFPKQISRVPNATLINYNYYKTTKEEARERNE